MYARFVGKEAAELENSQARAAAARAAIAASESAQSKEAKRAAKAAEKIAEKEAKAQAKAQAKVQAAKVRCALHYCSTVTRLVQSPYNGSMALLAMALLTRTMAGVRGVQAAAGREAAAHSAATASHATRGCRAAEAATRDCWPIPVTAGRHAGTSTPATRRRMWGGCVARDDRGAGQPRAPPPRLAAPLPRRRTLRATRRRAQALPRASAQDPPGQGEARASGGGIRRG